jgi:RNA-directed DNA polymerase
MIFREETKSVPITKEMVWEAYKKVKSNAGSAGIDDQSLSDFDQVRSKELYKIWNRLASGSYFAPSIKRVTIPKGKGRTRPLGIPTVGDRVAQPVIKAYLEPRLESVFLDDSYGYRPNRNAHSAIRSVQENVLRYNWVIDLDIKEFFEEVSHELLMRALRKHVPEKWVLMYIERWLAAPVVLEDGTIKSPTGKGTPQGGVISPLLANLYLHYSIDKWLEKYEPKVRMVRYADDVIIHCRSHKEASQLLQRLSKRLTDCGLTAHPEKTKIVYCKKDKRNLVGYPVQFDFLGFSFQPIRYTLKLGGSFLQYDCKMSRKSKVRITQELKKLGFHNRSQLTIQDVATLLNPKIRGWIRYYGTISRRSLNPVFYYLHHRLLGWVLNKYKRFGGSKVKAITWLRTIGTSYPNLFYHWGSGYKLF